MNPVLYEVAAVLDGAFAYDGAALYVLELLFVSSGTLNLPNVLALFELA